MKIFVSYSSKDRRLVTTLIDHLEQLGHSVWYDQQLSPTGGQSWWSNILNQIRDCDLFIFALTPKSLNSYPCQSEYKYAHSLQKLILPVHLATVEVETLPIELQELQIVDYRDLTPKSALSLAGSLHYLPIQHALPIPLPPEPETPFPPLVRIKMKLTSTALTVDEQDAIMDEFERVFPDQRKEVKKLLGILNQRADLDTVIRQRIFALDPNLQPINAKTVINKGLFLLPVFVIGLLIAGIGGVTILLAIQIYLSQNPISAVPSPTQFAHTIDSPTASVAALLFTFSPVPTHPNTLTSTPNFTITALQTDTTTPTSPLVVRTVRASLTPFASMTVSSTPTSVPTDTPIAATRTRRPVTQPPAPTIPPPATSISSTDPKLSISLPQGCGATYPYGKSFYITFSGDAFGTVWFDASLFDYYAQGNPVINRGGRFRRTVNGTFSFRLLENVTNANPENVSWPSHFAAVIDFGQGPTKYRVVCDYWIAGP